MCDRTDLRVSKEDAKMCASVCEAASHHRTSSKQNTNVIGAFDAITREMRAIRLTSPLKVGWLLKRGKGKSLLGSTAFRRRYFVLRRSGIEYFDSDTGATERKGFIDFSDCARFERGADSLSFNVTVRRP